MTPDEIETLLLLRCGALPYPQHPDYNEWYGGGFGLDMLSVKDRDEHAENTRYMDEVGKACDELNLPRTIIPGFIRRQRGDL